MHAEKISEIIAYFIGYFDVAVDEARIRMMPTEGLAYGQSPATDPIAVTPGANWASGYALRDYDPGLRYIDDGPSGAVEEPSAARHHDFYSHVRFFDPYQLHGHPPGLPPGIPAAGPQGWLPLHSGPGSAISHFAQVNLLNDDDYLDMTSRYHQPYDMTFVHERLADYTGAASQFTPLGIFHRTDTPEGVEKIAADVHSFAVGVENGEAGLPQALANDGFVLVDHEIQGNYVNGEATDTVPLIDTFLPDRGLANHLGEPVPSDTPLELHGPGNNSLTAEAGANVVGNYAAITTANIITPVMSVLGDYHQVDVINQAYVYSDVDHNTLSSVMGPSGSFASEAVTTGINIALFDRHAFSDPSSQAADASNPVFPDSWHVSVVEGDLSFVQWIEQYNFISDNDQLTVTSMGFDTTVLTGGNEALNLTSYLGIGLQYDLVIIGGNVYDMNMISQIAVLYDNDWVAKEAGVSGEGDVSTSGNLVWNEASITNIGDNDRFEAMPDYMKTTVSAIEGSDPVMPSDLAHDPNFAGYGSLNVLYVTGNLYELNYVKQVSVLGDSDMVARAASENVGGDDNAIVTLNTGANTVFNIAEILDYDSVGDTTYLSGNLYSDAVLIQGGLVEQDTTVPQPASNALANEVIAFLGDDGVDTQPVGDPDPLISQGDITWHSASPVDAMQTVVA